MALYPITKLRSAGIWKAATRDIWRAMAEIRRIDATIASLEVGSESILITATGYVVAGRAVVAAGLHASSADTDEAGRVLGVAANSAGPGDSIVVVTRGLVSIGGFATGDVLYLAENGGLTTQVPTAGFQQRIGIALTPSLVLVSLSEPIHLS